MALIKQPTEAQVKQLAEFLLDRTEYSFITFVGFITAVIGGARQIPTAEWQTCLLGKAEFQSPEEESQIKETLSIFYHLTAEELNRDPYVPFTSRFDEHETLPAETRKFVYLGWLSGYCLGTMLAGKEWLVEEHYEAAGILAPIMEFCEILDTTQDYQVTREDLEMLQTHVKGFHEYWVVHRTTGNTAASFLAPKQTPSSTQAHE